MLADSCPCATGGVAGITADWTCAAGVLGGDGIRVARVCAQISGDGACLYSSLQHTGSAAATLVVR